MGLLRTRLYKYVKIGAKVAYLKKINNDANQRKSPVRLNVVDEPKIKEFLKEFGKIISAFYQKIILSQKIYCKKKVKILSTIDRCQVFSTQKPTERIEEITLKIKSV